VTAVPEEPTHRPLRIATVPFATAYGDAVLPEDVVRVRTDAAPSPWLDPDHLSAHAHDIDVLHLHGGYDHLTVPAMDAWTAAVRRTGVPLVVTVQDLRPPEGPDGTPMRTRHRAHLRALLTTAEVVLTLTPGVADEIADRFGRTAIVVAHPSLAAPTAGIGRETRLVGVHL
jgi:hypothetical protein